MSRSPSSFAPRLESLDSRTLPSVTSTVAQGVLTITGDAADDNVLAAIYGDTLFLFADGGLTVYGNASALGQIDANLGDGNNRFRIDLNLALAFPNDRMTIGVNTGTGSDRVKINSLLLGRNSTLITNVQTGIGSDNVALNLGIVSREANVGATVGLGDGDDTFSWNTLATGRDAHVLLNLDAGAGNDSATANLGAFGRTSAFTGNLGLGAGDDSLTLASALNLGVSAAVNIDADLGIGVDTVSSGNLSTSAVLSVIDPDPAP